jgi:Domain of unknown function (DUF222)
MSDMERLEAAIADFDLLSSDDFVDPRRLSAAIDRLQGKLCRVVHSAQKRGDHLVSGHSPCSFVATICQMSRTSASDRLCVGKQLESLPRISAALASGSIGYEAASVICHLSDQLGEKRELIDEEAWVGFAQRFTIRELRFLTYKAREQWDPEGMERDDEEDYEQRYLHLSPLGRMWKLDALLDPEAGAALRTAIDALSNRAGSADRRSAKQRRADGLGEIVHHALDQGTLPRRNGARPHVAVHTTVEGLRGGPGSSLEDGTPIAPKTVQRLACDATLSRIVKAGSVVVDVGRATRSVSPAQWRALKARYKTCAFPGCDRPINWTSPHHVEFWASGGKSDLPNLLPLCYYHHRLVHEGRWQVIRAGEGFQFIPPELQQLWEAAEPRRWGEQAA